jgi:hypothetical protein
MIHLSCDLEHLLGRERQSQCALDEAAPHRVHHGLKTVVRP